MSLFILSQEEFLSSLQNCAALEISETSIQRQICTDQKAEYTISSELKRYKQAAQAKIIRRGSDKLFTLWFSQLCFNLKGLFCMKLQKNNQNISFWVDLLTPHDQYYKIANHHQIIQICHNILFHHSRNKNTLARLGLNTHTRQIKVQLPLFFNSNSSFFSSSFRDTSNLLYIYKNLVKPHFIFIQLALTNILKHEGRARSQDYYVNQDNRMLDMVYRYNQMLNVSSHLSNHYQSQKTIVQKSISQRQSIKQICQAKIIIQAEMMKNISLFNFSQSCAAIPNSQQQFVFSPQEQTMVKCMLAMPILPKNKNPYQNSMVLNYIFLNESSQNQKIKINKGGFSEIYHSEISYWYVFSSDEHQFMTIDEAEFQTERSMLRKPMVIKRQLIAENIFDKGNPKQSRNKHQLKIIKKIKNGSAIFFPKYYIPVNKPNPFANCLLVDYIPFKTLGDFLTNNRNSLGLVAKLCYMFSICQALRYLRDYKIVHLDLKPNNIMIYWNMLIKLIDFGQSYHPDVCRANHKPGFTIPYSSPEIYTDKRISFTSKCDIFSMGVIFYQILFDKCPFQIHKHTTFIDEQMRKYLSYWYYSPQQYEAYGDGEVIRVIINLISKCISVNPDDRPQLDWIALIIRHLCEIVN